MTTTWNIDATHSTIGFSIRHMVFSKVRGRFLKYTGAIKLEDDVTKSRVEVSIEAASIDTGTAQRDTHLRSADFFDVEKFPELRFRSTRVEDTGGGRLRVIGDLTIRDVTREVALDAEPAGRGMDPWGNERSGFAATISIDRKDFGLHWNQLLEAGGVLVSDRVDIELDIQAVKMAARNEAA
ncbi:YceI family protein [Polyangium sp. y55x31]|uniref:YceI family protein n=1 Tax=Polyangium sp. y55x31 TaxID=3042688 RepID=UPI0024829B8C|nr:YceI family protein [Polyangium sp. y55x31]MDI1484632.1 YceI family protein [Polyangium sp. y55x31]